MRLVPGVLASSKDGLPRRTTAGHLQAARLGNDTVTGTDWIPAPGEAQGRAGVPAQKPGELQTPELRIQPQGLCFSVSIYRAIIRNVQTPVGKDAIPAVTPRLPGWDRALRPAVHQLT